MSQHLLTYLLLVSVENSVYINNSIQSLACVLFVTAD